MRPLYEPSSFFIGLLLLLAAYQVYTSPLGLVLVVATIGLMIGFWFIERACLRSGLVSETG